ncbi:MAG: cation:dicarboxylase symporter family transporter, partial [Kofleriaceae bacterium]
MASAETKLVDRKRTRWLYAAVILAILLGIVLGLVDPKTAEKMKPLGDGFIKLIKMTIAPLIFCTVVAGIAGMTSMKAVGKVGGLALLYFEVMSSVALIIGLVIVNVMKPGVGMNLDVAKLDVSGLAQYTGALPTAGAHAAAAPADLTVVKFLLDIIPDTFVGAFTRGELLPVLLLAILFGFALQRSGERGQPVRELVDRFGHVVFGIVGIIMYLAPIGAFGAMAFTVGKHGVGALASLGELMACFYATCLLFVFVVLGAIARVSGFSIFRFVRFIRDELFIVLGTSSSESVLPRM